jgi:hypothetical protein
MLQDMLRNDTIAGPELDDGAGVLEVNVSYHRATQVWRTAGNTAGSAKISECLAKE